MARIPESYINEVVDHTDIVAVVGDYVKLKKSGLEYKGLCPFHNEKSPSFSVNPEKGVYYCRGCGATGNPINFLSNHLGMSFIDSLEKLARDAGLPAPSLQRDANEQLYKENAELASLMQRAQEVYREELKKSPQAQEYLKSRGIDEATAEAFGIGFSPYNKNVIENAMRGVPLEKLHRAGILAERKMEKPAPGRTRLGKGGAAEKAENRYYEWMNGRIVFPIRNSAGKTIALGGRSMQENPARKYINTPETPIFSKGAELYGLFEGSNEIRKQKTVVVTEGYVDVVIPSGAGFKNIVSCMGTALQARNIEKLFKMAENIVYCFDGDEAGKRAAFKAMQNTIPMVDGTHKASFAFLPSGMDPDDYVKKHGLEAFETFVSQAMPLSKYVLNEFSQRNDMSTVEGKAKFVRETMELIGTIEDPMMRKIMTKEVERTVGFEVEMEAKPAEKSSAAEDGKPKAPRDPAGNHAHGENGAESATRPARTGFRKASTKGSPSKVTKDITAAPEAPTLPIRMLSLILADTKIGAFLDPEILEVAKPDPEHQRALRDVTQWIKGQGDAEISAQAVLDHFSEGEHAPVIDRAHQLYIDTPSIDPVDQTEGILRYLKAMQDRVTRTQRIVRGFRRMGSPD